MLRLKCAWCGRSFDIYKGEVTRWLKRGRDYFFCSISCGVSHSNDVSEKKRCPLEKKCPVCSCSFTTHTGKRGKTFCSRACASRGSVTPLRRARAAEIGRRNLQEGGVKITAAQLYAREGWKYASLKKFLTQKQITHEFEYPLPTGKYVFDLALPKEKILVEFDGPYHSQGTQRKEDAKKERAARKLGWDVKRVRVIANARIRPSVLFPVLQRVLG